MGRMPLGNREKGDPMKKIISCDLPLKIQRLYIKRLKHMIWRWEYNNFCGHCPVNKRFGIKVRRVKAFSGEETGIWWKVCRFCKRNVKSEGCPCDDLGPEKALKRAKDFIERFETGDSNKPPSKGGEG